MDLYGDSPSEMVLPLVTPTAADLYEQHMRMSKLHFREIMQSLYQANDFFSNVPTRVHIQIGPLEDDNYAPMGDDE